MLEKLVLDRFQKIEQIILPCKSNKIDLISLTDMGAVFRLGFIDRQQLFYTQMSKLLCCTLGNRHHMFHIGDFATNSPRKAEKISVEARSVPFRAGRFQGQESILNSTTFLRSNSPIISRSFLVE